MESGAVAGEANSITGDLCPKKVDVMMEFESPQLTVPEAVNHKSPESVLVLPRHTVGVRVIVLPRHAVGVCSVCGLLATTTLMSWT